MLLHLLVALCCLRGGAAVYEVSIFNASNYYPVPWFSVNLPDDLATLANNALVLRLDINDPRQFSQSLVLAVARRQREQVCPSDWLSQLCAACSLDLTLCLTLLQQGSAYVYKALALTPASCALRGTVDRLRSPRLLLAKAPHMLPC